MPSAYLLIFLFSVSEYECLTFSSLRIAGVPLVFYTYLMFYEHEFQLSLNSFSTKIQYLS